MNCLVYFFVLHYSKGQLSRKMKMNLTLGTNSKIQKIENLFLSKLEKRIRNINMFSKLKSCLWYWVIFFSLFGAFIVKGVETVLIENL